MTESGDMGYTGEGAAGAPGGTAGAAGGAGEPAAPLEGASPSPNSGTWTGASPEPVPTPTNTEEVTAPPEYQGAVASPGAITGEGQGVAAQGGTGALGAPDEAAGSIPPGAGRGPDAGPNVAGAEDAARAQGPMRQEASAGAGAGAGASMGERTNGGGDQHPELGASGLGTSSGIDVAGTNATDEGAGSVEAE